jgi:hypothetical protein
MPSAGFEPAIPATKRPQTHALDNTVTGIGKQKIYIYETYIIIKIVPWIQGLNIEESQGLN